MKLLIYSTHEMKFFWYLPKKSKFSFYFFRRGEKLNFFHSYFSLIFAWLSGFSGYNIGCKHAPRKWLIMSF